MLTPLVVSRFPQITVPVYPSFYSSLHVALMPRYGNPDLLLTTDGSRPSLANFGASSTNYIGTDVIDLSSRDRLSRAGCARVTRPGATCTFAVAVYGNDASAYNIIVSLDGRSLPLQQGMPVVVSAAPGLFTYFTFGTSQVPVTPSGTPSGSPTPSGSGAAGASSTATGSPSSSGSGGPPSSSPSMGSSAAFTASMTPTQSGSASVAGASPTGSGTPSGAPSPSSLPARGSDVVFTLTSYSGLPAMYVTSAAVPNAPTKPSAASSPGGVCAFFDAAAIPAEASSASASSSSVGRVTIKPGDACFCAAPCTYYVGVGAATDATQYSIVVVEGSASAAINLLDGMPQDGSASPGVSGGLLTPPSGLFDFEFVPASSLALAGPVDPVATITLDLLSGSGATLYAIFESPGVAHAAASPAYFHYKSVSVGGSDTITVLRTDPAFVSFCGNGSAMLGSMCTMEVREGGRAKILDSMGVFPGCISRATGTEAIFACCVSGRHLALE